MDLKGGLADLRGGQAATANAPRTDQDLSMKFVIGGIFALIAMIMIFPQLNLRWNILGAVLIVAFGFLFVTVSSRLTGEIGSSSNPISGMTVATLLLTCLDFSAGRLDRSDLLRHGAFDRRHCLHCVFERRHHVAGFEDRIPGRLHANVSADCNSGRRVCVGADPRSNSVGAE